MTAQATEQVVQHATPPAHGSVQSAGRNPYFDNAKFLALLLVVCGHTWGTMAWHSKSVTAGYEFLYMFHMPVFVLVSGYLSRSFTGKPGQWRRMLTGVVVPFVVAQVLFIAYTDVLSHGWTPVNPLAPQYHLWFLPALFIWRMSTPLWRTLRPACGMALALLACFVAGYFPLGQTFDIPRVLQFLPFFVAGLYLRPEHFTRLSGSRPLRVLAVPILVGAAGIAYWRLGSLNLDWLMRNYDHQALNVSYRMWLLGSTALLAVAVLLGASFLALVPKRATWFTAYGERSLYGYLLHPFVTYGGTLLGWFAHPFWWTPAGILTITAVAVVLGVVLSSRPVQRLFRPLFEPRLSWMFVPTGASTQQVVS